MGSRCRKYFAVCALGAVAACGGTGSEGAGNAAWSTAPRTVAYEITESHEAEKRSIDLKLEFGESELTVTELGSPKTAQMSPSGRLSYVAGDTRPAPLYELIALSVLPPAQGELTVGQKWSYTRPEDAEAEKSTGLVAQERFDYEIVSLDSGKVNVSVKGFLRIAPTAGVKALLAHNKLPENLTLLLGTYKPYVVGSAEFDRKSGETLSASGSRLPFAFLGAGDHVPGQSPASVTYSLVRQ